MGKEDCIFCRIIKKDIPSKVVFEDPLVLAFEDVKAQAPVHILVIPKEHIEKVSDLTEQNAGLVGHLVITAKKLAEERGLRDAGYRMVLNCGKDAGQAVFHVHLHLLGGRKFSWPPG